MPGRRGALRSAQPCLEDGVGDIGPQLGNFELVGLRSEFRDVFYPLARWEVVLNWVLNIF